jgi:hypothetical protein
LDNGRVRDFREVRAFVDFRFVLGAAVAITQTIDPFCGQVKF